MHDASRRRWLLGLGAAVTCGCGGQLLRRAAPAAPATGVLRVMSLNLAHGRGLAPLQSPLMPVSFFTRNLDVVAELIRREQPHLVALQEAELGSKWAGGFNHVRYLAVRAGMPHIAANAHMDVPGLYRYGTALISRIPFEQSGGTAFATQHRRWRKGYSWAVLSPVAAQRICVVTCHLDFDRESTRVAQAVELVTAIERIGLPAVLVGDLNSNGRAAMTPLVPLTQLGALEPACTLEPPPTNRDGTNTIDWVLKSPTIGCLSLTTRTDPASDHRPVIAELTFAAHARS